MKTFRQFSNLIEADLGDDDHSKALSRTGKWGKSGAGCILGSKDIKKFLMPFRSIEVLEPHTYGTWGGAIDETLPEDENGLQKVASEHALRELREESGFNGQIVYSKLISIFKEQTFRYFTFLFLTNSSNFKVKLNWETERANWMTVDEFFRANPKHPGLTYTLSDPNAANTIKKIFG